MKGIAEPCLANSVGENLYRFQTCNHISCITVRIRFTYPIYGLIASPSDCLESYPKHLLEKFFPTAEKLPVYSAAPAGWVSTCLSVIYEKKTHTHTDKLAQTRFNIKIP